MFIEYSCQPTWNPVSTLQTKTVFLGSFFITLLFYEKKLNYKNDIW